MTKKTDVGEIHAPVEDTDVPGGLRALVILLIIVVLGLAVALALGATQMGLFNLGR